MLSEIGLGELSQLFGHIDPNLLFLTPSLPEEESYFEVADKISEISNLSNLKVSFIGDQLPVWKTPPIVDFVSNLRNLQHPTLINLRKSGNSCNSLDLSMCDIPSYRL